MPLRAIADDNSVPISAGYVWATDAAGSTLVKSGRGAALSLIISGGTLGNVKIYDGLNATGTLIFDIDPTAALALPHTVALNCYFREGLFVVRAAATKLTLTYL